ncbi:hypothetical protein BJ138DRAFT_1141129 [Hygrophoropsis aurantiaca]|uniref:Uncharacterized protein n=1 Tax=Hygrophoropsis aurantiaca TaxID=72124 RepID=A0ACB8AQ76_9AGAM|nr:hypothetical protein BJ138DRAFT_1141129 [Hygrophoropsis aurantiaca]
MNYQADHNRMHLNNYLQQRFGRTEDLTWEVGQSGPLHQPQWVAIAHLRGVPWGRGQGHNRGSAMEMAAGQVLQALQTQRF